MQASTDSSIFGLETGSSSTSTSSNVRPPGKDEGQPRLFPSPVAPNSGIKNRPPMPSHATSGPTRLDSVQRSTSTRGFRSSEKKHLLKLHSLDD